MAAADSGSVADSTASDTTTPDTTTDPDTTAPDTDMPADSASETPADSSVADSVTDAVLDTKVADTTVADTTVADTTVADTTVADTAVADTAVADTAVVETSDGGTPNCGAAPYLAFDPLSAVLPVTGGPATPITISANICPATTVVVAKDEKKSMNVPKGVPFFLTGSQTGSLPGFSPEYNLNPGLMMKLPSFVVMWPTIAPATLANPAWDPATMGFIYLGIGTKSGATAPCDTKAGATFIITGHTEAVFKYTGGGTTTDTEGLAWATIVTTGTAASPEYTTVTATKPGCTVSRPLVFTFLATGRIPFAKGTSTLPGDLEISN